MNTTDHSTAPKPRSQFVTVLAWFSIAVSILATLSSLMQNIMLNFVFPKDMFEQLAAQGGDQLTGLAVIIFSHYRTFALVGMLMSIVMLVVSVGLLHRKRWAHVAFVVLLAISIVAGFAPLLFSGSILPALTSVDGVDAQLATEVATLFRGVLLALALLFAVLHGWLLYKLCTPKIRAEFA